MAQVQHLERAPIREALIDFRAVLPPGFSVEVFRTLADALAPDYPVCEERRIVKGEFIVSPGREEPHVRQDPGLYAVFFRSSDDLQVAQFRADGFSFSRLRPYTTWSDTIAEAMRLWRMYVSVAHPSHVSRIAARYINDLDLPFPITDFRDFLTAPPAVPSGVPDTVSSFFLHLVLHDRETGVASNLTQAMEQSADPNCVTIILDIDCYLVHEYAATSPELATAFDRLHEMKNRIFFSSITERTASMYK